MIYTDVMVFRLRIGLFLFAVTIATTAIAQSPASFVVPHRIEQSAQVDAITSRSESNSSTVIEGDGQILAINYSSDSDLQIFLFYLHSDNSYDPADTVIFSLPAGDNVQTNVDLTHSSGWHPGKRSYKMTLMSDKTDPIVSFASTEFVPTTIGTLVTTPVKQLSLVEIFTPSSYHALHGYTIFGQSFATLLGILALFLTIMACVIWRKRGLIIALSLLIGSQLIYGLRFSIDELRFTAEHVKSWYSNYTYDEAQSTYELASLLKQESIHGIVNVFVCRNGTDFREKLLRYFSYPISVSSVETSAKAATHIVVMDAAQWSYDAASHTLSCNEKTYDATHVQTLKDGTQLFSSPSSPRS